MIRPIYLIDARLDTDRQPIDKDLLSGIVLIGGLALIVFLAILCGVCRHGRH